MNNMLAKAKISQKRLIIYILIIILMVVGNIYIFQKNSGSNINEMDSAMMNMPLNGEGIVDYLLPVAGEEASQPSEKEISSPVEHDLFTNLKKIGDWPIIPKNVGKVDPFAPLAELVKEEGE